MVLRQIIFEKLENKILSLVNWGKNRMLFLDSSAYILLQPKGISDEIEMSSISRQISPIKNNLSLFSLFILHNLLKYAWQNLKLLAVTPPAERVQFILGEDADNCSLEPHPLFTEMEELIKYETGIEWKETARYTECYTKYITRVLIVGS